MKKNIGNILALYPTPLVVVGTMVNGKPNWVLVGHVGIIGHDRVMVSLARTHYTNQGIKETNRLSINIVDETMLPRADHAGCVSGAKEDKSELFDCTVSESGVPMIMEAPVVMECTVDDIYVTDGFESFICKIDNTYAEESVLTPSGKINYRALQPVLFEMPTYEYLRTGSVIGKCMSVGKNRDAFLLSLRRRAGKYAAGCGAALSESRCAGTVKRDQRRRGGARRKSGALAGRKWDKWRERRMDVRQGVRGAPEYEPG